MWQDVVGDEMPPAMQHGRDFLRWFDDLSLITRNQKKKAAFSAAELKEKGLVKV
jgi:hypothetical protein